jgi:hypothetical protein
MCAGHYRCSPCTWSSHSASLQSQEVGLNVLPNLAKEEAPKALTSGWCLLCRNWTE